ncbi:MAG: redoxin domain-containing protein [Alphaproteobacteria bacterium]|nr:redoxin domain-containing protein [Alphaproteobacteria bacterium]
MKPVLLFTLGLALLPFTTPAHAAPEIGNPAPEFMANDVDGHHVMLSSLKGKTIVLEWSNPDCPFVHKQYDTGNMQAVQKEATKDNVIWITIDSSAKGKEGNYPAPELKKIYADQKANFSHLIIDESGEIGKLYAAKTTPHMFVINEKGVLVYAGAIDDKSGFEKEEVKTAKNYILAALNDLKAGRPVAISSTKPYGCSVKY